MVHFSVREFANWIIKEGMKFSLRRKLSERKYPKKLLRQAYEEVLVASIQRINIELTRHDKDTKLGLRIEI